MSRLVRLDRLDSPELSMLTQTSGATVRDERRVLQKFSPRLAVVSDAGPDETDLHGLNEIEVLAVRAWTARSMAKAPRPLRSWNAPGYKEPVHVEDSATQSDDEESSDQSGVQAAPEWRTMTGSIAVGIVIVSGDDSGLAFNTQETQKIIQEVTQATQFLASAEPRANVSFDFDFRPVSVSVATGTQAPAGNAYERLEAPWRDAALQEMGYGAGIAGYRSYVADLKADRGTQWAYVAFFTKYPVHHFAYAENVKVVMHFDNDGWGPDDINAVFAHETCHIFGAADEYGACGCHTLHGALQAPNSNCVNCNTQRAACLMDQNQLTLCQHSRLQLGWGPPHI